MKAPLQSLATRVLGDWRTGRLHSAYMASKIRLGRYRLDEIDLLPQLVAPGDTVIDVGASYGVYSYHLARITGENGSVVAFEAEPRTCGALRRVLRWLRVADRVDIREAAVGAEAGTAAIAVPRTAAGGLNWGSATLVDAGSEGEVPSSTVHSVLLTRLDTEVPATTGVSFIKVDVEGADLDVLLGAERILERDHPSLLIEIAPRLLQRRGHTGADVGLLLERMGYATFRYDRPRQKLVAVPADGFDGDLVAVHRDNVPSVAKFL